MATTSSGMTGKTTLAGQSACGRSSCWSDGVVGAEIRRLPRDLLWAACCLYYAVSKSCVESSVEDVGTRIGSMAGRLVGWHRYFFEEVLQNISIFSGPPSHSRAAEPRDQQRNSQRGILHSHDHRTGALIHQRCKPGSRFRSGRWPKFTTSLLTKKKIQIECNMNCKRTIFKRNRRKN